jgi:hypothetical protein
VIKKVPAFDGENNIHLCRFTSSGLVHTPPLPFRWSALFIGFINNLEYSTLKSRIIFSCGSDNYDQGKVRQRGFGGMVKAVKILERIKPFEKRKARQCTNALLLASSYGGIEQGVENGFQVMMFRLL